jgi:hypothetical protein
MTRKTAMLTMLMVGALLVSSLAEASGKSKTAGRKGAAAPEPKKVSVSLEVGANPARINSCVVVSACGFDPSAGEYVALYQNDPTNAPGDNSGGKPVYARLDSKGCFRASLETGTLPAELRLDAYPVSSAKQRISKGTPVATSVLHVAWDATRTRLVENWSERFCEGT